MDLNVKEMLVGHPIRLRYVYRFSTSRVQHPESVAEHSYYVCLYSLLISRWCESQGMDVNSERLMERAVLHDLEESRSGDFPRPFKHSTLELKMMLEKASSAAMCQVCEDLLGRNEHSKRLFLAWMQSKDDSPEGRILEFADFLSVLSFMHEELGAGGNHSIQNHVKDMGAYFEKFKDSSYDFIRPLVKQADALMREVFPRKGASSVG